VSRLPGGDPSGLGLYCGGSWLILPVSGFKVFLHPMVGVFIALHFCNRWLQFSSDVSLNTGVLAVVG